MANYNPPAKPFKKGQRALYYGGRKALIEETRLKLAKLTPLVVDKLAQHINSLSAKVSVKACEIVLQYCLPRSDGILNGLEGNQVNIKIEIVKQYEADHQTDQVL